MCFGCVLQKLYYLKWHKIDTNFVFFFLCAFSLHKFERVLSKHIYQLKKYQIIAQVLTVLILYPALCGGVIHFHLCDSANLMKMLSVVLHCCQGLDNSDIAQHIWWMFFQLLWSGGHIFYLACLWFCWTWWKAGSSILRLSIGPLSIMVASNGVSLHTKATVLHLSEVVRVLLEDMTIKDSQFHRTTDVLLTSVETGGGGQTLLGLTNWSRLVGKRKFTPTSLKTGFHCTSLLIF